MQTAAAAHPNIALIKYWGKQEAPGNRPAVPSISVTLDSLHTRTRLSFDPGLRSDVIRLNDREEADASARVSRCLDEFRARSGRPDYARVETWNNFPTGAGLASSASGFAALVVAANQALELDLPRDELSRIARRSSGSAARSLFGGFVEMPLSGEEESGRPLLDAAAWPLAVVVAVTATGVKSVGSTEGMERTARTSDYYTAWLSAANEDFEEARTAVWDRDFARLARVSEKSCLKMHALMLSAVPGIIYWNEATVACLHRVRSLRELGLDVFFTMDAGPQVKAICLPEHRQQVAASLGSVRGVTQVLETGLGEGARLVDDAP